MRVYWSSACLGNIQKWQWKEWPLLLIVICSVNVQGTLDLFTFLHWKQAWNACFLIIFTQIIDSVHRIFQEYTTFLFKHFYIAFVDIILNFHGSRTCILVKRLILTLTIAKRWWSMLMFFYKGNIYCLGLITFCVYCT